MRCFCCKVTPFFSCGKVCAEQVSMRSYFTTSVSDEVTGREAVVASSACFLKKR